MGVLLVQLDTVNLYFMSEYEKTREAQFRETLTWMSSSPGRDDGEIEQLLDLNTDFCCQADATKLTSVAATSLF